MTEAEAELVSLREWCTTEQEEQTTAECPDAREGCLVLHYRMVKAYPGRGEIIREIDGRLALIREKKKRNK